MKKGKKYTAGWHEGFKAGFGFFDRGLKREQERLDRLKAKIEAALEISHAFEWGISMVAHEKKSLNEVISWMISEQKVEPFGYHLMFDLYAPIRCKHVEGDDNICEECLDPILNEWHVKYQVLNQMAIEFIIFWEDETGIDWYTGKPRQTDEEE